MPIAVSVDQTSRYVAEEDRKLPEDQQTVFLFKPLTARERAQIQDVSVLDADGSAVRMKVGTIQLKTVEYGLIGWENFNDASGTEVVFNAKDKVKNLDRLSPQILAELYEAVATFNTVGAEEEKNSN